MTKIVFSNKGEIDPISIKTFGVSAKENSNAIGYFGTGLKYAIAILLREKHSVSVYSGLQVLEFTLESKNIRGNDFNLIKMNNEHLAFTTELGKNWEVWQAYRELYCNMLDENGSVTVTDEVVPQEGITQIVVSGNEFLRVHKSNEVILKSEPIDVIDGVEIHDGYNNWMYYQGIKTSKLPEPSKFTYNITDKTSLTEDRTFMNLHQEIWNICKSIVRCPVSVKTLEGLLIADTLEKSFDFHWPGLTTNNTFTEVVKRLHGEFKPVNRTAIEQCKLDVLSEIERSTPMELDSMDVIRLKKAISFCTRLGYPVNNYEIIVTDFMGQGILGRAAENKIFLSHRVFQQGTKQVAATLIEEFVHLRYGYADETYTMQTFLFDALVSVGERALGEPL